MAIRSWKKIGEPEILAKKFGRRLVLQKFEDPYKNTVSEYSQFGGSLFACIFMPVTQEGQVLAIRQFRHGANRVLLELPGGNPKTPDQLPEGTAREELFEESFGYIPKRTIRLNFEPLWFDPASLVTPFYAFLGLDCLKTSKKGNLDEGEYVELVKIPFAQWLQIFF